MKLKNQNKLIKKDFKENYATGNKTLDVVAKKFLKKKYLVNNEYKIFEGFKNIIVSYAYGFKSYDDIVKEQTSLLYSPNYKNNDNNIENNINIGYNIILHNINDNKIQLNKEAILKDIRNKITEDKPVYIRIDKDNIVARSFPKKIINYVNQLENNSPIEPNSHIDYLESVMDDLKFGLKEVNIRDKNVAKINSTINAYTLILRIVNILNLKV